MRVLLSAYACEPNRGSEPAVGWEWATRLAKSHDVWVLTRANNREVIERELGEEQGRGYPHFIYVDLPVWAVRMKDRGVVPLMMYYLLWQWVAARRVKGMKLDIDLVHHVTFAEFRFPGMWWRCPWIVVLGPLGGASVADPHYRSCFGRSWWREWIRSQILRSWRLNPWTFLSFRRADALVFVTHEMERKYGKGRARSSVLLETALPDDLVNHDAEPVKRKDFLWVGTLEGRKGWRLALESFARAFGSMEDGPCLRVVGDGRDHPLAEQLANDLGIANRVRFLGNRKRAEVWEEMWRSKGLFFSSVRDTSGNVVLEAMALECPVLCLNHQGSAVMTDETCALRVDPGPWDKTIEGFAAALRRLESEPGLVDALGQAGRDRVRSHFRWERSLATISGVYLAVMRR